MKLSLGDGPPAHYAREALQGPFIGLDIVEPHLLRDAIVRIVDEQVGFFSVDDFGTPYHSRMALQATVPSQFVDTFLSNSSGMKAIAGIRFVGLDPGKPFVDLLPLCDLRKLTKSLKELSTSALDRYAIFQPQFVRVCLSPTAFSHLARVYELAADMRTFAKKIASGDQYPNGAFGQCEDIKALHEQYEREFEIDLRSKPYLRPHRTLVAFDDFKSAFAANLVGVASDQTGELRGFVLLEPGIALGLEGFVVRELMVWGSFRRQGLGKRLLNQATTMALKQGRDSFLFAPIHDSNGASMGAAISAGFAELTSDYFMTMAAE